MIKTNNVTFQYDKKLVLNGITMDIPSGEFVAIVGCNGSGKSTLAKHFNAILLPKGGTVYVNEMDTQDEEMLYQIRQTVGMVFQNPDNQIVATVVEEDVAFAPENLGVPSAEIRMRVDGALAEVGMSKYIKHAPHLLSGGQKQRIAIAGVLAMNPSCIVLDEPTAMLDPIGRREVMSTLRRLNKNGITIALITHNMDEAVLADRVLVMEKGNIVLDGTPSEIFRDVNKIKGYGLDVPQVTELIYKLSQSGFKGLPDNVLTIDSAYDILKDKISIRASAPADTEVPIRNDSDIVINAHNLTHDYSVGGPFEKRAIHNVSMQIKKGEFIALIGHTGSGKSTVIQHFNGLLKPTGGNLTVNGIDITDTKTSLRQLRQKVGLVFQYPEYQLFEETVWRDIAFAPKNMGLDDNEIAERVKEAAAAVGINDEMLEKSPFELSGGQKRRVAIAGVLAMQPEILILDEPTAGLDPKGRKELLKLIRNMHKSGMTVIVVSHGMEDVASIAERIYVMNDGTVHSHGTPLEVYKDYVGLEKIGLTAPQVTKLIDRLCGVNVCTIEQAEICLQNNNGIR